MSSFTRQQLEDYLKTIDVKGSVLDIGGAQNSLKGRTKSWNPKSYEILDLKQPHEIKEKIDIEWDINKNILLMNTSGKYGNYDMVFMIEVSEYIYDPITVLTNIYSFLKPGGIFYSSWHFLYPQHKPLGLDYLRYTPQGVVKLLNETGFEILEHKYRLMKPESYDLYLRFIQSEGMRGWKEYGDDNMIIGSIIKARTL